MKANSYGQSEGKLHGSELMGTIYSAADTKYIG